MCAATSSSPVAFVFGSRDLRDEGLVARSLKRLLPKSITEVWSGGARGADRFAARWARAHGITVREFKADWDTHGKSAGIQRSAYLISQLPAAAACIAFVPPCVKYPGAAAIRHAGGVREFLSPGTRYSAGECLARGFSVAVVWACGTFSVCTGRRPLPPRTPSEQTWKEREDVVDTSVQDMGEVGFDTGQLADRSLPRSFDPSEDRPGEENYHDAEDYYDNPDRFAVGDKYVTKPVIVRGNGDLGEDGDGDPFQDGAYKESTTDRHGELAGCQACGSPCRSRYCSSCSGKLEHDWPLAMSH